MSSALHALEALMQYQNSINAVANEDISSLPCNALIDPLNHIVPKRPV